MVDEFDTQATEDVNGDGIVDESDKAPGLDAEKAKKAPTTKKKITPPAPKFPCKPDFPTLKVGDSGETVKHLQKILKGLGQLNKDVPIDGKFGPQTETAVKRFQQPTLDSDGIVGPQTWKKLCDNADFWNKHPNLAPKVS